MKKIKYNKQDIRNIISSINTFSDDDKKNRIDGSIDLIVKDSNHFETCLLTKNRIAYFYDLSAYTLEKDDMIDLYSQKFTKSNYYSKILFAADCCPICELRPATTVDHYFPKSTHYIFSVSPFNLIPMCFECNKRKGEIDEKTSSYHVFHPYFDNYANIEIVFMNISFEHNVFSSTFSFYSSININIRSEFEFNFNLFKLRVAYGFKATDIFDRLVTTWEYLYTKNGKEDLRALLSLQYNECSLKDKNSVDSLLFKGLLLNFDNFVSYIENKSRL